MTMKTLKTLALALAIAAAPLALAHGDIDAKHGGVTKMQNDLGFELVPSDDGAAIYIEDHGKPVPVAGMSGKLTVLNGSQKSEAQLVPAGDRLEAKKVKVGIGSKVVAAIQTADRKAITVRFAVH
jgi:hypothetical protein